MFVWVVEGVSNVTVLTWDLLGPGDHVDQLLVGHAGEQGHHGDLGVGPVHLLPRGQYRRLRPLEHQEHLENRVCVSVDKPSSNTLISTESTALLVSTC